MTDNSQARRKLLSGERLKTRVAGVLDELGKTDRDRVARLLPLFSNGEASLAVCLKTAFADKPLGDQLNQLTKLRKTVNDTAVEHGRQLRFCVDTEKKQPPEARRCWF